MQCTNSLAGCLGEVFKVWEPYATAHLYPHSITSLLSSFQFRKVEWATLLLNWLTCKWDHCVVCFPLPEVGLPVNLLAMEEKRRETWCESETSTSTGWQEASKLPDSARIVETVSSQSERLLPATATDAPSLASCWHTARPIPVPPPAVVCVQERRGVVSIHLFEQHSACCHSDYGHR